MQFTDHCIDCFFLKFCVISFLFDFVFSLMRNFPVFQDIVVPKSFDLGLLISAQAVAYFALNDNYTCLL